MCCSQFYRPCGSCGNNVHQGFTCSCGGDPWRVLEALAKDILEIKDKISFHENKIIELKKILEEKEKRMKKPKELV